MTSLHETIKTAYEVSEMTVEQIAEDQALEVVSVKSALMSCSSKYRKACGQEEEIEDLLNFSKQEQQDVKRAMFELALSTEDEHVKAKLLMYIRDDSKGRRDRPILQNGNTFNILQFNQSIQRARQMGDVMKRQMIE